ncbi:NAD(P)H-hydrate dehydratase [Lacticaseibacillus thailandensis]|uniref:ADP-dependent (S)-NAD(P)H-hydrate dehydratase n=1 Tax=Lacticaseibacillus thailandensis DSM 22698 = JCM 13996 TaxID=1423810 RepID=A0A0R2C5C4_9LACO|nr:NAD(P)H-hydrate dehydratase [Lacticaseibacillus thailandensis]KRM86480.1 sugar kinase [Lacticaseibacillus thailandensis DSM 22698 = JCM 13996]
MDEMTRSRAANVVRPRTTRSHKGMYGRVVIVAGDEHFGGAAIMSATAAVYAGAGLVTVATAAVNHAALHARLPEAMVCTWTDAMLPQLLAQADVVVVGPGLGDSAAAHVVLQLVLDTVRTPQSLIVDGSAIDIMAAGHQHQTGTAQTVWTPHAMEWQRLSGIAIANQTVAASQAAAAELPGVVVCKGAPTVTLDGHVAFRNTSGGPAMATGGSGDTLTGIIAAFIGQFGYSLAVVAAAVWVHSAAADMVARSQYVALPTAVSAALPTLMAQLSHSNAE